MFNAVKNFLWVAEDPAVTANKVKEEAPAPLAPPTTAVDAPTIDYVNSQALVSVAVPTEKPSVDDTRVEEFTVQIYSNLDKVGPKFSTLMATYASLSAFIPDPKARMQAALVMAKVDEADVRMEMISIRQMLPGFGTSAKKQIQHERATEVGDLEDHLKNANRKATEMAEAKVLLHKQIVDLEIAEAEHQGFIDALSIDVDVAKAKQSTMVQSFETAMANVEKSLGEWGL